MRACLESAMGAEVFFGIDRREQVVPSLGRLGLVGLL
jgi:hypothetical protein